MTDIAITKRKESAQPIRSPTSVCGVLLASVGRQRLCTPLRSLLARGDEQ